MIGPFFLRHRGGSMEFLDSWETSGRDSTGPDIVLTWFVLSLWRIVRRLSWREKRGKQVERNRWESGIKGNPLWVGENLVCRPGPEQMSLRGDIIVICKFETLTQEMFRTSLEDIAHFQPVFILHLTQRQKMFLLQVCVPVRARPLKEPRRYQK